MHTMLMIDRDTEVIDVRCGERAWIRHAVLVPPSRDLFGLPIPEHWRYTVEYESGYWANDRRAEDLETIVESQHVAEAAVA